MQNYRSLANINKGGLGLTIGFFGYADSSPGLTVSSVLPLNVLSYGRGR